MNTLEAINARRSVRGYSAQPIEQEKLDAILKCANVAPKSGPFTMTVIRRKGMLDNLEENLINVMKDCGDPSREQMAAMPGFKCLYNAPCLVIFSIPEENPGNSAVSADCAAATMCIAATDLGLGSCYMMTPIMACTIDPMFKDIIQVPAGFEPYCGVLLGYEGDPIVPAQPRVEDSSNINYYD